MLQFPSVPAGFSRNNATTAAFAKLRLRALPSRTLVSHTSAPSSSSTMAASGRVDFVIGVVGALLLAHGAFSTIQYRGALKIREEDFTYPPAQVLVEVALSLVLCLWAALKVPGSFLPILPDAKENRVTKLSANSDFMIFNHRGKIFLPELVEAKFL